MNGPNLPGFRRRPVMTRLHSRSTLLRLQKRRSTAETMPTLRYHRIESTSRYLLFHLHPTCGSA